MILGQDWQYDMGNCIFDNNGNVSVVFNITSKAKGWYLDDSKCDLDPISISELVEADSSFNGYGCKDSMCFASQLYFEDMHTTVCIDNMDFFSATELNWMYWGVFNPIENGLNSICALGHEKPAEDATSFLARAVYNGLVSNNIYSFVIDPYTSYDNFNPLSGYPTQLSQSVHE
jgi:hypothetical protein